MIETVRVALIFSAVVAIVNGNQCDAQGAVDKLCTACQQQKVYFHVWNFVILDNIKPGTITAYGEVVTNKGDGYNQRTGKFTAPRDGPYVFTWTALTTGKHRINLDLVVPGRYQYIAKADSASVNDNSYGSNTVVVELKKGLRQMWGLWKHEPASS